MSELKKSLRCALLFTLFSIALTGCTATPPQVAYYSLLGAENVKTTGQGHDQLVLSVGPVHIPDVLKKSQIATDGTEGRYRLSEYHRWAGEVDREFGRALLEQLAGRLGTEQAYLYPGDQHLEPTCQVLLDILEMNGELGKEARLSVRWTLIDPKGKTRPITRHSTFSQHPADSGHDTWVNAQRGNISRLSEEIATLIKERTTSNPGR
jgi:uncharacterized lipoprotein YmbA